MMLPLTREQLDAMQNVVLGALGVGRNNWIPGETGRRMWILLRGRQPICPICLDLPLQTTGDGTVRVTVAKQSFPDLMLAGWLDGRSKNPWDARSDPPWGALFERYTTTVSSTDRDAFVKEATILAGCAGPTPWPRPVAAPKLQRIVLQTGTQSRRAMAIVLEDGAPTDLLQSLCRVLSITVDTLGNRHRRITKIARHWRRRLRRSLGEQMVVPEPTAPQPKELHVLRGRCPSPYVEYGYDYDEFLYLDHSSSAPGLCYRVTEDVESRLRVDLRTGDVATADGTPTAPSFLLAAARQAYPLTGGVQRLSQLPLRVASIHADAVERELAWLLHFDTMIGPALAFLDSNCPSVLSMADLAPSFSSADLLALRWEAPTAFDELTRISPMAVLCLLSNPAGIRARRPLDAALEAVRLPNRPFLRRWLQRVETHQLTPRRLAELLALVRSDVAGTELRSRLSHGLLDSHSSIALILSPLGNRLSNADLEMLARLDARETSPSVADQLDRLTRTAAYLGLEPRLGGLGARAKTLCANGVVDTVEAGYAQALEEIASEYVDVATEAEVLDAIGIDHVDLPIDVRNVFEHTEDTFFVRLLATHKAIRQWGSAPNQGANCLGNSWHYLTRALLGKVILLGLGPRRRARFRHVTIALEPLSTGVYLLDSAEGTGNRRVTAPGGKAFERYLAVLAERGLRIVSPQEARGLGFGIWR